MKRKIASLFIALAMLASMGSSIAYADESGNGSQVITDHSGSASIGVFGSYDAGSEPDAVYSVNVSWQSMQFSCKIEGEKIWDPNTHTYSNRTTFKWDTLKGGAGTQTKRIVTVTNKSNVAVRVTSQISKESGNHGFGLSVYPNSADLESYADEHNPENIAEFDVDITPPSRPDLDMPGNFKLGTVTITVNTASPGSP